MTDLDLDAVRIASPCPADWSAMSGDDRRRLCSQCKLHVYDLSAMTRAEATALVAKKEGRLCVRFFRRADGTMLTQDCPVGLRQKLRAARVRAVAMAAAVFSMLLGCVRKGGEPQSGTGKPDPIELRPLQGEVGGPIQGDVLVPSIPEHDPVMGLVAPAPIEKK
jgi:hypothetical protein